MRWTWCGVRPGDGQTGCWVCSGSEADSVMATFMRVAKYYCIQLQDHFSITAALTLETTQEVTPKFPHTFCTRGTLSCTPLSKLCTLATLLYPCSLLASLTRPLIFFWTHFTQLQVFFSRLFHCLQLLNIPQFLFCRVVKLKTAPRGNFIHP